MLKTFLKAVMMLLAIAALLAAQVPETGTMTISCDDQPMATTKAVAERVMGQWVCWITNDGTQARTLTPAKFFQAIIELRPIPPANANLIISDSINGLARSKLVKIGGPLLTIGSSVYGAISGNLAVPLGVGLGVKSAPQVLDLVSTTVPKADPYISGQMVAPVTIPPLGDLQVQVYCAKRKAADLKPITKRI